MKVLCIEPMTSAGLYGGRIYTALSAIKCPNCGKGWFEIAEAAKPQHDPAMYSIICCSICNADLPGVTLVMDAHMFRQTRFIPIDPAPTNQERENGTVKKTEPA